MTENTAQKPVVGIVMGSDSDWAVMQNAALVLKDMGVAYEARVVSAHRMPDEMFEYAETAKERGIKCIIAGAGGAAHLPGMIAAKCVVPVLGVPVATFAIGEAGAANAALYAVSILAVTDEALYAKLQAFRKAQNEKARNMTLPAL